MTSKQVVVAQIVASLLIAYLGLKVFEHVRCEEVYGENMCVIHDYDLKKLNALKSVLSK